MRSYWWPLSIKTPVLGIDRGRVSIPADLTCLRRLKMFWVQKIIFFIFCVFKVLQWSNTMGCLPVRRANPRALASGLSYVQVNKHGITILYHLHKCRPCTSHQIFHAKGRKGCIKALINHVKRWNWSKCSKNVQKCNSHVISSTATLDIGGYPECFWRLLLALVIVIALKPS